MTVAKVAGWYITTWGEPWRMWHWFSVRKDRSLCGVQNFRETSSHREGHWYGMIGPQVAGAEGRMSIDYRKHKYCWRCSVKTGQEKELRPDVAERRRRQFEERVRGWS